MNESNEVEQNRDPIGLNEKLATKPNKFQIEDLDKKIHGCSIFRELKLAKKETVKHVYDYSRRLPVPTKL